MEYNTLIITREEKVAQVQLNQPESMNAINQELVDELFNCMTELKKDQSVRVVVLNGSGRSFCAGGDISFLKTISRQSHVETRNHLSDLFYKLTVLTRMEKPVIGALHGYVLGAGFGLSLLCDIRIAAENTKFGAEFLTMGIIPEIGFTHIFPSLVGLGRAMELVLTARRFDTTEAENLGIINRVVPDDSVLNEALEMARHIANLPPLAAGFSKTALRRGVSSNMEEALRFEADINALCYKTEDHKEAASAFMEKRHPVFKGR